jgi:rhodanese-related sulfurtransferase
MTMMSKHQQRPADGGYNYLSPLFFILLAVCGNPIAIMAQDRIESRLLTPKDADNLLGQGSTLLVDVRSETEFSRVRIPASINIPAHFLRTKSYLKKTRTILINEGFDYQALLKLAQHLNKKGFDMYVVAGGIAAWAQQKLELQRELLEQNELHDVPSSIIARLQNTDGFIKTIIDVSREDSADQPLFTHRFPIRSAEDVSRLKNHLAQLKLDYTSGICLVNDNGDYNQLQSLLELPSPTLFFLKGGRDEYRQFRQRHAASLRPRKSRLQTIGGCAGCPPEPDD